ncbi:MAG TPA: hypothetical protein VMG10_06395 [Gemmataceae bacterium]|nr:hypothetical protein [Gemmataceae bacterium]
MSLPFDATLKYVLTALCVSRPILEQLYQGVRAMRESSAYQAILDEGRIEEAQQVILLQGGQKFGPPGDAIQTSVKAITDLERLHRMEGRILTVPTWDELLATH